MLTFGQKEILSKLMKYCAYQERCHEEVKEKLREFAMYGESADVIIDELIKQNFLNEERFAKAFAGGKFRQKNWGRIKITIELKQKKVSAYNIKQAMMQIDSDDYEKTLDALVQKKLRTLESEKNVFKTKNKIYLYLMQKGYEPELIKEAVSKID